MDNRKYNKIINGERLKYLQTRKQFKVGENSSEETCNGAGYYLTVDNKPTIDTSTQKIGGSVWEFDEATKTDVRSYTVVDIPIEELMAKKSKLVETAVQTMLDGSSKDRGYDSIISECSYATSTGVFGTEAQVTVNWRDAVWQKVFEIQADIIAQNRTEPTLEELMAELPTRS